MPRRLLIIEEAFVARGRGVLLLPRFTAEEGAPTKVDVVLRLPDGSERATVALLEVAHMRGSLAPYAMYRLPDLAPNEVPEGTELWSRDGDRD